MAADWYVCSAASVPREGGSDIPRQEVTGPFDEAAVQSMLSLGQLSDDDLISLDMRTWMTAREYSRPFEDAAGHDEKLGQLQRISPRSSHGAQIENGAPPPAKAASRDRIVVLGRPGAGKTVYLSTLYAKLWNSLDGLTMTSLSGAAHRDTMHLVADLANGVWPAATLAVEKMAIEVEYRKRKRLMISMDYSGEVFRRAFVEDDSDGSPEVASLLDHLDNAGGVMLLMDPSTVLAHSGDIDVAVDDDFGMVQAARRIRNWPGSDEIPIVVVLTKMDQHLSLIQDEGGVTDFVRNHWPALARTLKRTMIFMVSAVQVHPGPDNKLVPKADSEPVYIENPLKHILREMDQTSAAREQAEMRASQERSQQLAEHMAVAAEKRHAMIWTVVIAGMVLFGIFIWACIYVFS